MAETRDVTVQPDLAAQVECLSSFVLDVFNELISRLHAVNSSVAA
jgi:hypothetical protein